MDRYGKITDLKANQKIFDEVLYTTMHIDKYFEKIDDLIQYADNLKQLYTAHQITNNFYNTVLATGIYTNSIKLWQKNPTYEKRGLHSRSYSRKSIMISANCNA